MSLSKLPFANDWIVPQHEPRTLPPAKNAKQSAPISSSHFLQAKPIC